MITSHRELTTYQKAMQLAMDIFKTTEQFPSHERYSLIDQIRRSSRSVCANLAEAWRKRRYKAAFVAKLNDAEGEASETQVWIELAEKCGYLSADRSKSLDAEYELLIGKIVRMIEKSDRFILIKS